MTRMLLAFALTVFMTGAAAAQSYEDNWEHCDLDDDSDLIIGGCTGVIQSGQASANDLFDAYRNRGNAYTDKKQYDLAIADLTEAIGLKSDDGHAYNDRGVAYGNSGDSGRAIDDYTKALALGGFDDQGAYVLANRAVAYSNKNAYDQAFADIGKAIALDPKNPKYLADRANFYDDRNQYRQAIADLTEALSLDKDDADLLNQRGTDYMFDSQYAKAVADFTDLNRRYPKEPAPLNNRGLSYNALGQYDLALADFDQAISLTPDDAVLHEDRGLTRLNKGDFAAAAEDLARAMTLDTPYADGVLYLHLARAKAGTEDSAELAGYAAKLDLTKWPGPVINLFLGRSTLKQVVAAAATGDKSEQADNQCLAAFYLGEYDLLHKQAAAAKQSLQKAVAICPHSYNVYVSAVAELKRQH